MHLFIWQLSVSGSPKLIGLWLHESQNLGMGQNHMGNYGSNLNHQGTAGFSLWFHLPGFHFGYLFLTHSHITNMRGRGVRGRYCQRLAASPSGSIDRLAGCIQLASICLRILFIFPCWFEGESITDGKNTRGLKQMEVGRIVRQLS